MNQYIALIRLSRTAPGIGTKTPSRALASQALLVKSLARQPGVSRASHDPVAASLLVWFDRAVVTVADLVRLIEEAGIAVSGISQSKSEAASLLEAVGA